MRAGDYYRQMVGNLRVASQLPGCDTDMIEGHEDELRGPSSSQLVAWR
jgi:hypothetical protein